jgi:hypothetical protein
MSSQRWGKTLILGAAIGAVVLGGGGRIAMHVIARSTTGTGSFTLGGTMTVVLLGAISGVIGALFLVGARRFFAQWSPTPTVVYWALLILVTLRGINPVEPLKVLVFFPIVIMFGLALQLWTYQKRRENRE